jgi:hypothetical protein
MQGPISVPAPQPTLVQRMGLTSMRGNFCVPIDTYSMQVASSPTCEAGWPTALNRLADSLKIVFEASIAVLPSRDVGCGQMRH